MASEQSLDLHSGKRVCVQPQPRVRRSPGSGIGNVEPLLAREEGDIAERQQEEDRTLRVQQTASGSAAAAAAARAAGTAQARQCGAV